MKAVPAGRNSRTAISFLAALVSLCPALHAQNEEHLRDRHLSPCEGSRDLALTHGKIVTMDAKNSIVSSVNIKEGRIVGVGGEGDSTPTSCTRVIDLHGKTAIPGLIDNHIHFVALGLRPGTEVTLDTSASLAEIQQLMRQAAASAPADEFLTAIGGWSANQLQEKRLPTLAELDAASADRPVLLVTSIARQAVTNSRGKAFFEAHGVEVKPDGQLSSPAGILRAVFLLKDAMTPAQKKRNTERAMTWAAGLGLTTVMDMGSHEFTGRDTDTIGAFDESRGYDPLLSLARENKLKIRYRLNLISWDTTADLPLLKARLANSFLDFGSDMIRISCIGESVWTFDGPAGVGKVAPAPAYAEAVALVAKRGYCYEQHSLTAVSNRAITTVWEHVNATTPIAAMHWRIAHAVGLDSETIDRLKAMGAGVGLHGLNPSPFRTILDSGIHAGAGSDGRNAGPSNPWLVLQYLVTGKNSAGVLDNAGQTLNRLQALRFYTADNGWFSNEEDVLGSIEPGKFADIVILDKDYSDAKQVPDEEIKRLHSLLTVVNGSVVYDNGQTQVTK